MMDEHDDSPSSEFSLVPIRLTPQEHARQQDVNDLRFTGKGFLITGVILLLFGGGLGDSVRTSATVVPADAFIADLAGFLGLCGGLFLLFGGWNRSAASRLAAGENLTDAWGILLFACILGLLGLGLPVVGWSLLFNIPYVLRRLRRHNAEE